MPCNHKPFKNEINFDITGYPIEVIDIGDSDAISFSEAYLEGIRKNKIVIEIVSQKLPCCTVYLISWLNEQKLDCN